MRLPVGFTAVTTSPWRDRTRTAIGVAAMGALVLLTIFCVVVAGVVERAAQRRSEHVGRIALFKQQQALDRFSLLPQARPGGG